MQPLLLLLDQGKLGKLVLIPLDLDLLLGILDQLVLKLLDMDQLNLVND